MTMMRAICLLAVMPWLGQSLLSPTPSQSTSTARFGSFFEDFEGVGYNTQASKPLGVVFSENSDPYFGLVVEDVEAGQNGGKAGLRVGDNLIAVNGESCVGQDFDTAMGKLINTEGSMNLQMYRGPVRMLYTILSNMNDGNMQEDEVAEGEEIIMDENYETPFVIEVEEEKPLTPGDVFNALKKVGSMMMESDDEASQTEKKEKGKGGFFGGIFSGETVQLDGDEASGLK